MIIAKIKAKIIGICIQLILKSLSIFFISINSPDFSFMINKEEKLYKIQVNARTIQNTKITAYQGSIIYACQIIPISLIKRGEGGNQTSINNEIISNILVFLIYLDNSLIFANCPVWVYKSIFQTDINEAVFKNECQTIWRREKVWANGVQSAHANAIIHIFSLLE